MVSRPLLICERPLTRHSINYASFDDAWMREMEEIRTLEVLALKNMYARNQSTVIAAAAGWTYDPTVVRSPDSFAALRSLTIEGMQHGMIDWSQYIVSFLLNAKGLEELVLSAYNQDSSCTLGDVCDEYARRSVYDGRWLKLRILHLGRALRTPPVEQLRRALDLSVLETFVSGQCWKYDSTPLDASNVPSSLDLCDPAVTPRLRNMVVLDMHYSEWDKIARTATGREFLWAQFRAWTEPIGAEVYRLAALARVPRLRLPPPTTRTGHFARELKHLYGATWLTHLELTAMMDSFLGPPIVDHWPRADLTKVADKQLRAGLPPLCEALATMTGLTTLQAHLATLERMQITALRCDARQALEAAQLMARTCKNLRPVRFAGYSFVVVRPVDGSPTPIVSRMCLTNECRDAMDFWFNYGFSYGRDATICRR